MMLPELSLADTPASTPVAAHANPLPEPNAAGPGLQHRQANGDGGKPKRRRPRFYSVFSLARGDYELDDDTLGLDKNNATLVRFRLGGGNERGFGGGIDWKFLIPEDDLYEGTADAADSRQLDLFFFAMSHVGAGRFRMPIRIGGYFSGLETERVSDDAETRYDSTGVRLEFEPEVVLSESESVDISLISLVSGGVHVTLIDDDIFNDEFYSTGATLNVEFGVRARVGHISLSTSFIYSKLVIDESDAERGLVIPRVETEFIGVELAMGVRF